MRILPERLLGLKTTTQRIAIKQGRSRAGPDWDALPIFMVLEFRGLQRPYSCGCQTARTEEVKGEARMRMLLRDIVLFSCLVAFVAGLVIAAATLLI